MLTRRRREFAAERFRRRPPRPTQRAARPDEITATAAELGISQIGIPDESAAWPPSAPR
jgi:hypothetical protein